MRRTLIALNVALATSLVAQTQGPATVGGPGEIKQLPRQVMLDSLATWSTVPFTVTQTFNAAKSVLAEWKVPVESANEAQSVIVNRQLKTRRQIAGHAMSWALRCGGSGMFGDNADSWRITLAYSVFVLTAPDNSAKLGVALIGSAEDPAGVSHRAVECASTGNFEQEFAKVVKLRLAAGVAQ